MMPPTRAPDPHGQAALMLCESLLYLLVEGGVIGKERAAEAIDAIIDLQREMIDNDEAADASRTALGLLQSIAQSLLAVPKA
jgi:hypothetical protein